jgi:hypothetical protein
MRKNIIAEFVTLLSSSIISATIRPRTQTLGMMLVRQRLVKVTPAALRTMTRATRLGKRKALDRLVEGEVVVDDNARVVEQPLSS